MIKERVLVSLPGKCPLNCKHCFALEQEEEGFSSMDEVIESISDKNFDIIYVSHLKENFVNPEEGVCFCERLFERYRKDICVTSRCVLTDVFIQRLSRLNAAMKEQGHRLFWCESIPALESAALTEDLSKIPTPHERINFLEKLENAGITTIMSVRPLFPSSSISKNEIGRLIEYAKNCVSAVITGGLIVTPQIEKRFSIDTQNWEYSENNSDYLVGVIKNNAKFVDVNKELTVLSDCCKKNSIPFFLHSMQAINYCLANAI